MTRKNNWIQQLVFFSYRSFYSLGYFSSEVTQVVSKCTRSAQLKVGFLSTSIALQDVCTSFAPFPYL